MKPARLLPALLACLLAAVPAGAAARTGEAIYTQLCLDCHGARGEGVAGKHDEVLYGERSLESLARYIDRTMPEDEPELLDAEGSKLVAEYIFQEFYSPAARARANPPKIDLARLTVRQYRESVADLFASFRPPAKATPPGGLQATYHQSQGMNKKHRLILEQVDGRLDFDFGTNSPHECITEDQFSIAWEGSLVAAETGVHEFRLRTPNGARLYVNTDLRAGDSNRRDDSDARRAPALIDLWVSSGEAREETAKVFLLGGRSYPLRLDYFKFKDKTAAVRLESKPPHGVWSVLDGEHLSPVMVPGLVVAGTPFPPDDRSVGYERGAAVSKEWDAATTRAALDVAAQVVDRLGRLSGSGEGDADRVEKLKAFSATLVERAFRGPLTPELRELYVERPFAAGVAPEVAAKRAVMLVLKSPRFLFPDLGGSPDDHAVAARLALALWDSLPDDALRGAAAAGLLRTPEQVRAQSQRMMDDARARAKLREFFDHWLMVHEAADLTKDAKVYPGFNAAIVADLRESLGAFVEHVVWGESSDYRKLLLSEEIFLNPRLAEYYGVPAPADGGFAPVKFDPAERAGIFTHPFLLAAFSYPKATSPIHRGVFLTRNVLGRFLKPPPQAIAFEDDRFDPTLTMREKVAELTGKPACMSCHTTINPLGFSLEHFDAVGRWRTTDNNKPVDAASDYVTPEGETIRLRGPRDLAQHAAADDSARRGFVRQLFQHAVKQAPAAYGADALVKLDARFAETGCHIRDLLVEISTVAAVHGRESQHASIP
ncbi:MAG: DUF1592 domain-containing protein [Limisphaerales bacterium]